MIQGLGIELVEIARFEALVAEGAMAELEAQFTVQELAYCMVKRKAGEHLAARHAAKRAAMKALGLETAADTELRAIGILRAGSGQPRIELAEPLLSRVAALGAVKLHLSMSHSGGFAVGMVVAEFTETGSIPGGNCEVK